MVSLHVRDLGGKGQNETVLHSLVFARTVGSASFLQQSSGTIYIFKL